MILEIELGFDELQLPDFGPGVLIYGVAYLQSTGDGEFWVQSIKLDGGAWLHAARESGTMASRLYREISAVLYDESTPYGAKAAEEWAIAWSDSRLPDPVSGFVSENTLTISTGEKNDPLHPHPPSQDTLPGVVRSRHSIFSDRVLRGLPDLNQGQLIVVHLVGGLVPNVTLKY